MTDKKEPFKVYKPKMYTEKDMLSGWKKQGKPTKQTKLDNFGLKMNNPAGQKQGKFNLPNPFGQKQKQQSQPKQQEEEEEPYWTAEQWEDWAISMYENVEESRQFLPDWVVKAIEENE